MHKHRCAALAAAITFAVSTPTAIAGEWIRDSAGNLVAPPVPKLSTKLWLLDVPSGIG